MLEKRLNQFTEVLIGAALLLCCCAFLFYGLKTMLTPLHKTSFSTLAAAAELPSVPSKVLTINASTILPKHTVTKESFQLDETNSVHLDFAVPLKNEHIQKAYLSLTNRITMPANTFRKLIVSDTEGNYIFDQNSYRIVGAETPWLIDVTSEVRKWQQDPTANKGLEVTADKPIELYSKKAVPFLTIEYSNQEGTGQLSKADKIEMGFKSLLQRYDNGPWTWTNVGVVNAQLNEIKSGNEQFRKPLEAFLGEEATFDSYYQAAFGTVMIQLDKEKYDKQIHDIHSMMNKLPQWNGVLLDNNSVESELAYLGVEFLAAYGEAYNDPESTNMAVTQMSNLYKTLDAENKYKVPFTLVNADELKTGTGWSRGVGWLFAGTAKLLSYPSVQKEPGYAELLKQYQTLAATLKGYQDETGLWHSVVFDRSNPLETTGTALFAIGYQYGINAHLLGKETYSPVVAAAEEGLVSKSLTGTDMGDGFPSNQDLNYNTTIFSNTRSGFGLWLELESLLKSK